MPAASSDQRSRAPVLGRLAPLAEQLAMFNELPMPSMSKLLSELQGALDSLFQAGYKETRMLHFIRIIGSSLDGYLKRKLGEFPFSPPTLPTSAAYDR